MCLLLCAPFAWAEIDVDTTAKMLYEYLQFRKVNVSKGEQLSDLYGIEQKIDQELKEHPNNPKLWWLKGLNAWSYVHALQKPLTEEEKKLKRYYKYELTDEAFKKAIELDKSNEPHLTLNMFYSLKTFGSSDVHVEAARRILEEDPDLEPKNEIEMRGGIIQHLLRLERYEEVMKEIETIEQKYPDTEYAKNARKHYTEVIEKAKKEKITKKNNQPKTPKSAEKTVVAKKPQQTQIVDKPQKKPKMITEPKPQQADTYKAPMISAKLVIAISIMAAVILGAFIYFRRKKQ
jgi:hypothetical protein